MKPLPCPEWRKAVSDPSQSPINSKCPTCGAPTWKGVSGAIVHIPERPTPAPDGLRMALEKISSGWERGDNGFEVIHREEMQQIADEALSAQSAKETE